MQISTTRNLVQDIQMRGFRNQSNKVWKKYLILSINYKNKT